MPEHLIPYLLTCGSLVLTLAGWIAIAVSWRRQKPRKITIVALCTVTAIACYGAYYYVYYQVRPSPSLPPWKDPQTLDLAMLFLLAPIGMVVSFVAALRGASWWLMGMLELACVVLFLVGVMESNSV